MTKDGMTRFYRDVSVRPEDSGFAVLLDGRPVRTPAGAPLRMPVRALAEAVASEWDAQEARVRPERMPLTRLALTACAPGPSGPVIDRLAAYGETDLLCHRAEQPDTLCARQAAGWQPVLDWAAGSLGVKLLPVTGIRAVPQPPDSLAGLRRHLQALDPFALAAAETVASVTGSVVLALALERGYLGAPEAWRLSRIDEDFQIETWGEDTEARQQAEMRRAALEAAATVFEALRGQDAKSDGEAR